MLDQVPRLRLVVSACLLAALLGHPARANGEPYVALDLGTLGGDKSAALAINNSSQVVGLSETTPGATTLHAFLWNGVMIDLGTLGGDQSVAHGINNAGQIVGGARTAADEDHAFLYSDGAMVDLGTLGGKYSLARAVNDLGQITGESEPGPTNSVVPFVYSNGSMVNISNGYVGAGTAMNNLGDVAGWIKFNGPQNSEHAALNILGNWLDLGTLGGSFSQAWGLNDSRQVTGVSDTASGEYHAFLWQGGVMTDLGTFPSPITPTSEANGINSHGDVVGTSLVMDGRYFYLHAFLWSDGVLSDISSLDGLHYGWIMNYAIAINDRGQVIGHNDDNLPGIDITPHHAFILSPLGIPLPTTTTTTTATTTSSSTSSSSSTITTTTPMSSSSSTSVSTPHSTTTTLVCPAQGFEGVLCELTHLSTENSCPVPLHVDRLIAGRIGRAATLVQAARLNADSNGPPRITRRLERRARRQLDLLINKIDGLSSHVISSPCRAAIRQQMVDLRRRIAHLGTA